MNILNYFYLINNKKINSIEISKFIIKKIENSINKNYLINTKYNKIIKQAKYSDLLIKRSLNSILTGIPIVYKDIYNWKLLKTTSGSRFLKNYKCVYNSTITDKLKNLGVINFGKTNMDEFGVGSNNFNYYYGVPENNLNNDLSCGGSSGGVYMISKGIIPITIVSDTGGSARQPAMLNGLIGFKPTYGRISRNGMFPYSPTMDTVSLISSSIVDIAILSNSLFGFDVKDFTTFNFKKEDFTRYIGKNWLLNSKIYKNKLLKGLTIGISKKIIDNISDFNIRSNIEWVLNIFEFLGADIKYIHIKSYGFLNSLYNITSSIELYSNLSRYNSFIYNKFFNNSIKKISNFSFFNKNIKEKLLLGNYLLLNEKKWKNIFFCKKIRRLILENLRKIFKMCTIMLIPTICDAVVLKNSYNSGCIQLLEVYNYLVNISGVPAISINTGYYNLRNLKFPLGFQIVSNYFKEAQLFQVANIFINFKCF